MTPEVSVVIPLFNESPNVVEMHRELTAALGEYGRSYELILVDDGSTDDTAEILQQQRGSVPELVVLQLRRNFGQTLALLAGLDHSRGDAVVTLDGDLQNDPADIPRLLEELHNGADAVSGWRRDRQDPLSRRLPSIVANWLIRRSTGVEVHDQGCGLKAYRGDLIRSLGMYADMHRFIVTMTLPLGARIAEVEVRHHPRSVGTSHYGMSRVPRVLVDLFTLQMLTRFREWPLRWFATLGIPFLLASLIASGAALLGASEGAVVWSAVSFLSISTFGSCLLLGLLGEATLEVSARKKTRPVMRTEWGAR